MVSVHACPLAKLGGRDSGGMNVYVRELARDLGKRGIEVDVFTRWREKDDPRIQQIGTNARVVHIPSGPIGYWPKMAVYEHLDEFTSQLLEHVEGEGRSYDIVHAHYWLSAKVARTLEQRWKIPVVQMFHTLGLVKREVLDEAADVQSDVRVEIERDAVRRSAAIVAASEIELGELRRLYRADSARVAVIPCGVDSTVFHPVRQADAREALGRDQCERLILFVGRIEQIKGIDVLLRAMGLLFQRYPDLRSDVCLLVVGGALDPGDDAPETEKILELRRLVHEHRMESNVAFVGSRGQEELALYYAAADVCAVPSRRGVHLGACRRSHRRTLRSRAHGTRGEDRTLMADTFEIPKRAMAIFAHPDDVDFGCSGTLASWIATAGTHVTYCVITSGQKGT